LVYRAVSGKCPKIPGEIPGGKFSRREVSQISRNSPDGKFSPQISPQHY
jgi:hypothetical protein